MGLQPLQVPYSRAFGRILAASEAVPCYFPGMFDPFGWGLYLFDVSRIRVRVHWLLLLFWFVELSNAIQREPEERSARVLGWLLYVVLGFGSILLHELGHCFAARRMGGYADDILLWPLGGLAFCHCPENWKAHLVTAAGGPLVTLAIVGVSYPAFHLLNGYLSTEHFELLTQPYFWATYATAQSILVDWNFIILLFNLVPVYPMDGGRIFHALAWAWFTRGGAPWGGFGRASRLTLNVSRVAAVGGIIYGLSTGSTQTAIIFVWALLQTEQLRRGDVI